MEANNIKNDTQVNTYPSITTRVNKNFVAYLLVWVLIILISFVGAFYYVIFFNTKNLNNKKTNVVSRVVINQFTGRIVSIDAENNSVKLETLDSTKKNYTINITNKTKLYKNIPPSTEIGKDKKVKQTPGIRDLIKISDLQINEPISVVGKEDINLKNTITAIEIVALL